MKWILVVQQNLGIYGTIKHHKEQMQFRSFATLNDSFLNHYPSNISNYYILRNYWEISFKLKHMQSMKDLTNCKRMKISLQL